MYQGIYNGTQKHQPDLENVLERSWNNNLSKIIITAGTLTESQKALEIAKTDGNTNLLISSRLKNFQLQIFYLQIDYFQLLVVIQQGVMNLRNPVIQKYILTRCVS